jgi:hypothetical protein
MSEPAMFWTLVAMTLGGTPLPTDLVFDSIEACQQAEEQMVAERTRYATESGARSGEKRELPEFIRQNLVRGVCVPHVPVKKTHNLPRQEEPQPKLDPARVYPFSEVTINRSWGVAPPVEASIAPLLDYRLPQVPMAFRLTVRNLSDRAMTVRNPLVSFFLYINRPDVYPIELPMIIPEDFIQRMDLPGALLSSASHVKLRTATVNGKEDPERRNYYSVEPGSSLVMVFECTGIVGERILASYVERHVEENDRFLNVTAAMNLFFQDPAGARMLRMDEKIRLPVPGP